ncbi:hypothetical protein AVEN_13504-1 [Araneus ventricosus]|uniref:Uncharacterized protein n=1 Tax=Araneus ventricosus TaxID=182803 RepID=A0A4Y1ZUP4_ARAVE|nr:hypothetical protein AVEN_13504-1 [Araneus ventricosus]
MPRYPQNALCGVEECSSNTSTCAEVVACECKSFEAGREGTILCKEDIFPYQFIARRLTFEILLKTLLPVPPSFQSVFHFYRMAFLRRCLMNDLGSLMLVKLCSLSVAAFADQSAFTFPKFPTCVLTHVFLSVI